MADEKKGPLTGEALIDSLEQHVGTIRREAGIRSKAGLPKNPDGEAAIRYLGAHLAAIADTADDVIRAIEKKKLHAGWSFTFEQFQAAKVRLRDTQKIEGPITGLARDAQAEVKDARMALGRMVVEVVRTERAIAINPGLDKGDKTYVADASQGLEGGLGSRRASIATRRGDLSILRDTQGALSEAEAKLDQHDTDGLVKDAQKDLKVQYLSGEKLRPEDLVVAAPRATAAVTAPLTRSRPRKARPAPPPGTATRQRRR